VVNNILKSIKTETEFTKLKLEGKRKWIEPWLLMVYLPSEHNQTVLGFSISSRFLNSVKRNRLRRVLRSSLASSDLDRFYMVHFIVTRKLSQIEWSEFNEKKSHYYRAQIEKILN